MAQRRILEIEERYLVENLAEEYEVEYGLPPFNLSHWDPSEQMTRLLMKYLRLPPPSIVIPYIYSYPEAQAQTLCQLGFTSPSRRCWFVNSGTIAVLLGVWWLKAQDVDQVLVLGPTYFPILHMQTVMNLPIIRHYMRRIDGCWQLPKAEILAAIQEMPSRSALWITNPVFSTGCYLSEDDTDFLASILARGVTVVADECLSINGNEISRKLGAFDQFLGLYSPHKSLCINSTKFGAVVFDERYEDFFRRWTDILTGPLASSSHSAIKHFLGENFSCFQQAFFARLEPVRQEVLSVIGRHNHTIQTDGASTGNFITCYAPRVSGLSNDDTLFLKDLIWSTGATLIPGTRSHLDPQLGFSFRVNLARSCRQFDSALRRVTDYLIQASSH